jgi:hypothetical protein
LAKRAGYDLVPWFQLTWWVLWIYTFLTLFVMFLRPDFLNLTICLVGIYMMFTIEIVSKGKFRMLVVGVILSLLYDAAWFYLKHAEYSQDDKVGDGSAEATVRKFSLMMSYASFIFRVSHYYH